MQPTIGIDFTSAARERAGIGRYARELIRALARLDHSQPYVLFVPRDARPELLAYNWPPNFLIRRAPFTERILAALWHRARFPLPVEALIGPVQLFYSPDFLLPPTRARRTMVTVHDLSYVRVPQCFPEVLKDYLNAAVPRSVARADLILADAASTQRDLIEIYHVPLSRVRVLYSGVDTHFRPDIAESELVRVRAKYALGSSYLLSVGTIQPRKNYVRLIQSFHQLSYPDTRLVISGGKGWLYDEIYRTVEELGLHERVVFTGFTPDEDLPALYAGARLFVYPSLYEGFGLPVAEAMACGVPVVCSNASSLPEVAGDAALYFDPRDMNAMSDAIRRALEDKALATALRTRGLEQVQHFSWDKAANELRRYFAEG